MLNSLLGLKLNMSARFNKYGHRVPVTLIKAEPNIILSQKGKRAQLGFGRKKKIKKTENAFVKISGFVPRFIREVTTHEGVDKKNASTAGFAVGDKITVSLFEVGDLVKVTGITKGKGFAGGVKRWGFAGGPKTHGQSDRHRAPGSIGQTTTPGRVYKGKKMAGHMGASKKTITDLEIVEVDSSNNLLVVKGSIPGSRMGLLLITKTGRVKGYTLSSPPKEENEEQDRQTTKKDIHKRDEDQAITTAENRKDDQKSEEKEKENATDK